MSCYLVIWSTFLGEVGNIRRCGLLHVVQGRSSIVESQIPMIPPKPKARDPPMLSSEVLLP